MKANKSFRIFSWGVLGWNLLVILWGAYVRATGSGAGCGAHWPLCNGEVVPQSPEVKTLVEFTHRLSSGMALVLVILLAVWAWRSYRRGYAVRLGAALSLLFIIVEALIGAGLVLFSLTAEDTSLQRVFAIALHLLNTFLLLAALALTAWWAQDGERPNLRQRPALAWALGAGFGLALLVGMSGAVTALGDTLFPAATLAEGLRQDVDPAAHFAVRLRIWHPVLAVTSAFYLGFVGGLTALFSSRSRVKRLGLGLILLLGIQLTAGVVNLLLLAPVWMQIVHLLLADLVWIALVLFAAEVFRPGQVSEESPYANRSFDPTSRAAAA